MPPNIPRSAADILANATYEPKIEKNAVPKRYLTTFATRPDTLINSNVAFEMGMEAPHPLGEIAGNPSTQAGLKFKATETPETFNMKGKLPFGSGSTSGTSGVVQDSDYNFRDHEILADEEYFNTLSAPSSPSAELRSSLASLQETQTFEILSLIRQNRQSPIDLILDILDEQKPHFAAYQTEFYRLGSVKLDKLLDRVASSRNGRLKLSRWIKSAGIEVVSEIISEEMDIVQKAGQQPGLSCITPKFIKLWNIHDHRDIAPFTSAILHAAAETHQQDNLCQLVMPELIEAEIHEEQGDQK